MQTQNQRKLNQQKSASPANFCPTGDCPPGIDAVREIGLTPKEKRAIFFSLKDQIFKLKLQRYELLGRY